MSLLKAQSLAGSIKLTQKGIEGSTGPRLKKNALYSYFLLFIDEVKFLYVVY